MKRICALLLLLLTALSFSGCLDARSLERYGYVLGIGFDEGETMPFKVTLMLQNTQSDSDSQTNSGFTLVDAECRDLYEAIDTLNASLPYELNFTRTELVVLAGGLLSGENTSSPLTDETATRLRIRSNAYVFIALDDANKALEGLKNELDPNMSRLQQNFASYAKSTGLIPITSLMTLLEDRETQRFDAVAPLCGAIDEEKPVKAEKDSLSSRSYPYMGGGLLVKSGMKTGLAGAALLKDGRLVGLLCGQSVQLLLMATGEFSEGRIRYDGKDGDVVTAFARDGSPRVEMVWADVPFARVTVPLTALLEEPGPLKEKEAETWLEAALARDTQGLFLCCRGLGVDAFGFGKTAAGLFSTGEAWESSDWPAAYARMEAEFVFDVRLRDGAVGSNRK